MVTTVARLGFSVPNEKLRSRLSFGCGPYAYMVKKGTELDLSLIFLAFLRIRYRVAFGMFLHFDSKEVTRLMDQF